MSYYCITDASSIILYAPTNVPCVNITNYSGVGQIQLKTSNTSLYNLSLSSYYDGSNSYGYIQTQDTNNNSTTSSTSGLYLCLPNQYLLNDFSLCNPTVLGDHQYYITSNIFGHAEIDFVNLWSININNNSCGFNFYNAEYSTTTPNLLMSIGNSNYTVSPTETVKGYLSVGNITTNILMSPSSYFYQIGTSGGSNLYYYLGNYGTQTTIPLPPTDTDYQWTNLIMASNMIGIDEVDFINAINPNNANTSGFAFWDNGAPGGNCNLLMSVNEYGPVTTAIGQLSVGNIQSNGTVTATGTVTGGTVTSTGNITASGTVNAIGGYITSSAFILQILAAGNGISGFNYENNTYTAPNTYNNVSNIQVSQGSGSCNNYSIIANLYDNTTTLPSNIYGFTTVSDISGAPGGGSLYFSITTRNSGGGAFANRYFFWIVVSLG